MARPWMALAAVAALLLPAAPSGAAPSRPVPIPVGCGLTSPVAAEGGAYLAGVDEASLPSVARAVAALGGRVAGRLPRIGAVEIAAPASAAARLRGLPGVRWLERQRVVRAARTANDPLRRQQWGLDAIKANAAWDRETGSRTPVTVAILDTGVDRSHPDLTGRVVPGSNRIGGTSSQDDHGHGTHVAGIVGAGTNNRRGVAGVVWNARLLAVKVLDSDGEGTDCSVVNGYLDAVDAGARVVNMSLGSPGTCPIAFRLALRYGAFEEVVPVAAAGNSGGDGNPVESPASCPGVVAVGATDAAGRVAKFSGHHPYVAVSAPGVHVLSTYIDVRRVERGYAYASGTSMAAPFAAGVAALLLARHPDWTVQQVRDRLTSTARDLGSPGADAYYGAGLLDANRALAS